MTKFGSNLIGDEAITAENALTQTVESKVPIILELQKKIMKEIKTAISNGEYEVAVPYCNEDPMIDDWIYDWLVDLKYKNIEMYEINEEGSNDNSEVSLSWEPEKEEEEESDENENDDSAEEESKDNKLDPEMQKMYDSIKKEEQEKNKDEKLEGYKTFPRDKKEDADDSSPTEPAS